MKEKFEIEVNRDVLDIVLSQISDINEVYDACEKVMLTLVRNKMRRNDTDAQLKNPFYSYVYAFTDPSLGEINQSYILGVKTRFTPFYIGKGMDNRAFFDDRNSDVNDRISKIRKMGFEVQKEILKTRLSDNDALTYETQLISYIGTKDKNGPLLNRVGAKTQVMTEEELANYLNELETRSKSFNLQVFESNAILSALNSHKTIEKAAQVLGITQRTLYRRIKDLKLIKSKETRLYSQIEN